jgi:hypothetical protein
MPAVKPIYPRHTKQYGINCLVGSDTPQNSVNVVPSSPNRSMLMIQNTGPNPGVIRFDGPVQGDESDMLFASGSGLLFDRSDTVPETSISFGSALGTTFCVLEQVVKK